MQQREEIIKKSLDRHTTKNLSLFYNCTPRNINNIVQQGQEKLKKFRGANPNSLIKKSFEPSSFPAIDEALKICFYKREQIISI